MSGSGKKAREWHAVLWRAGARRIPFWEVAALAASLVAIAGFAVRGFDENGLRLGSQLAWRFAFLVYLGAISWLPLARLLRREALWQEGGAQRQLLWAFCASFGVFLASVLVPNTLAPATLEHQGLTIGMALFALLGGGLTMVIAYAAVPRPNLAERVRRTLLGVGLGYFWLAYALTSLTRLHDPDPFYGVSLLLLGTVLLLRLATRFVLEMRRQKEAGT